MVCLQYSKLSILYTVNLLLVQVYMNHLATFWVIPKVLLWQKEGRIYFYPKFPQMLLLSRSFLFLPHLH